MGMLYKRGRVWYIDVRDKGRRIRRRVGTSKKIAELALKDAEVKIARNEFGFARREVEIDGFLTKFLEYSRTNHAVNTTKRYGAVLQSFQTFLTQHPHVEKLSQITPELIEQYKTWRRSEVIHPNGRPTNSKNGPSKAARRGARASTVNFELDTLRTILYVAVKWGYLKENPVLQVGRLKVTDSKPIRFLSPDECRRIFEHCSEDLKPIYQTFLLTGMRKGELENLEWADVDFERRKIKIRAKEFWHPKTGQREIPIGEKLLPILKTAREANTKGLRSDFVFPHKDGGRIRVKLREKLITIAQRAGVENLTALHAFRHTFASQLVTQGVDLPTVQKLLGHTNIDTTMIYAHLAPDHLAKAVDRINVGV